MNMPNTEEHLDRLEGYSGFGTILQRKIKERIERYERINAQNGTPLDALPDFAEKCEKFHREILEELFASEKDLILAFHKNGSFKREEKVRCKYLARKERLMKMAEELLEKYPNLRQNATLIQKLSQYLFIFNGIFQQQENIAKDGKCALELMESSLPELTAEIAVLEHEKKRKDELSLQESEIVEVNGKQFIVIKVKKLTGKKLEIFAQRLKSALGSKLSGCQMHLLNNILEEFSCIVVELGERIENNPDDMTEYQQIKWIIEETLENLKKATGAEMWCPQNQDGLKTIFYIMGDMTDSNIGDIPIKRKGDEILIPRKMLRKRIQEAAKPFLNIFERIRQKSVAQMRENPIQDVLKEKRKTYNRHLRGIIEWTVKMAEVEEDEMQKRTLYEKALRNLHKVAPTLKREEVKVCYTRISNIEKILAEMAIRRGDNNGFADHAAKMVEGLRKIGKPYDENHPHFLALRKLAAQEAKKPPTTFREKRRLEWKKIKYAVKKEWNEWRSEMAEDSKTGE